MQSRSAYFRSYKFNLIMLATAISTFSLFVPPFFLPTFATSIGFSTSTGAWLVAGELHTPFTMIGQPMKCVARLQFRLRCRSPGVRGDGRLSRWARDDALYRSLSYGQLNSGYLDGVHVARAPPPLHARERELLRCTHQPSTSCRCGAVRHAGHGGHDVDGDHVACFRRRPRRAHCGLYP
jgi:hypothetical protein